LQGFALRHFAYFVIALGGLRDYQTGKECPPCKVVEMICEFVGGHPEM
jgi:hypothetical protein